MFAGRFPGEQICPSGQGTSLHCAAEPQSNRGRAILAVTDHEMEARATKPLRAARPRQQKRFSLWSPCTQW